MRIVGGAWRGRTLVAPPGQTTRPTADRVRQALFDMLMHAEWGGRAVIEDAVVLDVFAGTGALGLEALSRGAASACFIESDGAALRALRANLAACRAEDRAQVLAADIFAVRPASPAPEAGQIRLAERNGANTPVAGASLAMTPRRGGRGGVDDVMTASPASLVFLDPPYGQDLVPRALGRLREMGCISPGALVVAEIGREEIWVPEQNLLAERQHGAARLCIFRIT